jgi:hypothetical protein
MSLDFLRFYENLSRKVFLLANDLMNIVFLLLFGYVWRIELFLVVFFHLLPVTLRVFEIWRYILPISASHTDFKCTISSFSLGKYISVCSRMSRASRSLSFCLRLMANTIMVTMRLRTLF